VSRPAGFSTSHQITETSSHPFAIVCAMAQVLFLPPFAEVLEQVAAAAERDGTIDVSCRADVDVAVIAGQIRRYAAGTGRSVRCTPRGDRVEVRLVPSRRLGRAG
jgi:hypothetical protein